jgi:hypothetical protein
MATLGMLTHPGTFLGSVDPTKQPKGAATVGQFPTASATMMAPGGTAIPNSGGPVMSSLGGSAGGGMGGFGATFDQLFKQNPAQAYLATNMAPAGNWFQQNQGNVLQNYFGGNQQSMNQWINDSSQNTSGADRDAVIQMLMGMPNQGAGAPATNPGFPQTGGVDPLPPSIGGGSSTPTSNIGGRASITPGSVGGSSMPQFGAIGSGNMALDINQYLDPSMQFRIDRGTNALQSSAAARGGLLSGATLKGVNDYAQNVASQEYGNAFNRAFQDRGFTVGVDQNDRDFAWNAARDDRNFNFDRDRYNTDMSYRAQVDDRNFNFDRDRYNQDFNYRASTGDRDFNFNRDQYNQQFGYNAQRDDRNFNQQVASELARLGLAGTQGSTGALTQLAQMLNSNILAGGNAGAAGAIGGSNAINQMISQLLQQLQSQQIVGQLGRP